jgi:DNA replication licensing factor MCM7
MEQQTVSIAKAGLTTTLNARTSVLAAANPLYSRYNPNETAQKNINLPAALLSRFDLVFILLDNVDAEKDLKLAKHIAKVHQSKKAPETSGFFSIKTLRNYIALSKDYQPKISQKLTSLLVEKYVKKRIYYSDMRKQGERYITTRNLLALIRLCQARVILSLYRPA